MAGRPRRLKAAPETPPAAAPSLVTAVEAALGDMDWLKPSDEGVRVLARRYALEIEGAVQRSEELAELRRDAAGDESLFKRLQKLEAQCDVTKTIGWLGPQLQGVLRDLGGTPAARAAMKQDKPIGGRLAQLRASATPGEHDS